MRRAIAFAMTLLLVAALMGVALAGQQSNTELCLLRLEPYVDIVRDAGLYPSVYLAQALLETGHCSSPAINYNNFWGIKCRDDLCFAKDTWEVYDGKRWEGKALFQVFYTARRGRKHIAAKSYISMNTAMSNMPAGICLLIRWPGCGRWIRTTAKSCEALLTDTG